MMKFKKIILSVIVLSLLFVITGCGKKFTITFDSDGGTVIESQEVKKNEKATEPTPPTKDGYVFLYWELDDKEYDFDSKVTKNITLVAKYEEYSGISYSVTFDSNGGSSVSNQIVKDGESITKPSDPTKEGYKFLYWELDGEEYDFVIELTKNITLIAKWEKVETAPVGGNDTVTKYTVTFNSNGGSSIASKAVTSGYKVAKPSDPTKNGYTFIGWYLNDNIYNFNNSVTKNITLVAKWQEKEVPVTKYTVTFDSNGGSSVSSQSITSGGKASQPTNPTRSGYTFEGWYLNSNLYNFNNSVTGNITLVAKWQAIVVEDVYTIESGFFQMGSPQVKVFVKKNGTIVNASAVLDSSGKTIGTYNSEFNVILADQSDYSKIAKAKLSDGTVINISK